MKRFFHLNGFFPPAHRLIQHTIRGTPATRRTTVNHTAHRLTTVKLRRIRRLTRPAPTTVIPTATTVSSQFKLLDFFSFFIVIFPDSYSQGYNGQSAGYY